MTPGDLEVASQRMRALAGCDAWDVPLPGELALTLFGPDGYVVVRGLGAHGELRCAAETSQVRVSATLDDSARDFAAAHELGHYAALLESWALDGEALERACDVFAAALLMPANPYLRALGLYGDDWAAIAELFGVSETAAALRSGELTGRPIAVVAPHTCRARGDAPWPHERELRRWRSGGPGLRAARLRDDPRRTVLASLR